ncbi:hypothetical protein ABPG72_000438 [Tetrahymena utriculariae]
MIQKLSCPNHQDNPILFLNVEKYRDSALACVLCVSEKKHLFNLLPVQKIKQVDERSLFDSWPPFQEKNNDSVNDIKKQIVILIEQKEQKVKEIHSWFDQLAKEVNQCILERKNFILKQAEKASQLRENILKKYFDYSQNLHIKKCLEQNLPVEQIDKQLQNLIKSVYEKQKSQTQMFQNLIQFYQFINSQHEQSLASFQEDVIQSIKSIKYFNVNTQDIDLSESNIGNLFSDQANFDEFRKSIFEQFREDYEDFEKLEIFMKNSQNQLSLINSFVASDTCQKEEYLKIQYNKLKQFDISFNNLNFSQLKIDRNQLFFYFKKALNPKKKYIFRIRSKSFLSQLQEINVGLIKNLKQYIPEIDIQIRNNYNNINTQSEELEF